jgi:hypothetical protein
MSRSQLLLAALVFGCAAAAQTPANIPIRSVTPLGSVDAAFRLPEQVREIAGGRILVNDAGGRTLSLFDSTLQHRTILADTLGTGSTYPARGKLIPWLADSSLFLISDTRSLQLIDPRGSFVRVLALPRPQDFGGLATGGPIGIDDRGHLLYQGRPGFRFPPQCHLPSDPPPPVVPPQPPLDTVPIIRADFETRTADTVGRARVTEVGLELPIPTTDGNCHITAAKVRVNPSLPATDSWVVTTRGSVAIVRGYDYHIDWIDSDGTRRSTPKLPFDWRRLTDGEKQAKIDSAKRIIDSLTAAGGFRLRACGRGFSFMTAPPAGGPVTPSGGGNPGAGGGGGGGAARVGGSSAADAPATPPTDCTVIVVTPAFVPLDSMSDFIAPVRERSTRADLDGNVWILPTTSAGAKGGLLYDVVNPAGELVERVQLPAGRDILGFGRGGVLYLSRGEFRTGFTVERVRVSR